MQFKFNHIKKETFAAYCCLAGICLIWGSTFLALKLGVRGFPPFLFAGIRQIIAGSILTSYLLFVMKVTLPPVSHIIKLMLVGFLLITLGNGLVSWSSQYVSSSIAAIICSAMPVMVIFLNLSVNKSERPNFLIILGVLIGIGGILLVFSEHLSEFSNSRYSMGIFLVFVATVAWSIASFMMKQSNQTVNPFLNAGLQMIFGGIFCFPLSLMFDDYSNIHFSANTIYLLAYLILVGSVAAQAMYSYTLTKLPLTIASMYSYVNPLVALVGWLVLSEKLNGKIAIAILVTVLGIYLVNRGYADLKTLKVPADRSER